MCHSASACVLSSRQDLYAYAHYPLQHLQFLDSPQLSQRQLRELASSLDSQEQPGLYPGAHEISHLRYVFLITHSLFSTIHLAYRKGERQRDGENTAHHRPKRGLGGALGVPLPPSESQPSQGALRRHLRLSGECRGTAHCSLNSLPVAGQCGSREAEAAVPVGAARVGRGCSGSGRGVVVLPRAFPLSPFGGSLSLEPQSTVESLPWQPVLAMMLPLPCLCRPKFWVPKACARHRTDQIVGGGVVDLVDERELVAAEPLLEHEEMSEDPRLVDEVVDGVEGVEGGDSGEEEGDDEAAVVGGGGLDRLSDEDEVGAEGLGERRPGAAGGEGGGGAGPGVGDDLELRPLGLLDGQFPVADPSSPEVLAPVGGGRVDDEEDAGVGGGEAGLSRSAGGGLEDAAGEALDLAVHTAPASAPSRRRRSAERTESLPSGPSLENLRGGGGQTPKISPWKGPAPPLAPPPATGLATASTDYSVSSISKTHLGLRGIVGETG